MSKASVFSRRKKAIPGVRRLLQGSRIARHGEGSRKPDPSHRGLAARRAATAGASPGRVAFRRHRLAVGRRAAARSLPARARRDPERPRSARPLVTALRHPRRMPGQPLRRAPLRILFVSPGVLTGAHLVFVRREAEALRAAGHEVDVFGFDNSAYSPRRLLAEVTRLREAIRRARPDVLHAQFGKFNALVAACSIISSSEKVPLVITFRGTDINRNPRYSKLRSALGVAASQL